MGTWGIVLHIWSGKQSIEEGVPTREEGARLIQRKRDDGQIATRLSDKPSYHKILYLTKLIYNKNYDI